MNHKEITEALTELSDWAEVMDGAVHERLKLLTKQEPDESPQWDVIYHTSPAVSGLFALLARCLYDAASFNEEMGKGTDVKENQEHLSDAMHFALRQWQAARSVLCLFNRMYHQMGMDDAFPAPPWVLEHGEDDIEMTRNQAGEPLMHVHELH